MYSRVGGIMILIEGIGGIGGVVAARMIQAGYDVTLVTNNATITEAIESNGLQIKTPEGDLTVSAKVYTDLPTDQTFDAAYLIMKATGVLDAVRDTMPLLKPDGYVVTFQNGVVEDAVAEIIGQERVVSGIIGWGGTMHAPGVYEKTSIGTTHIGELDGQITPRLRELEKAMSTSAEAVVTTNIRGALWSKLAINCTITTIGALTGDTLGVMLQDKRMRQVFLRGYSEVVDTAEASGITLERIATNPHLLYVKPNAGSINLFIKDLLVRFVGRKYGKLKSSSLQSLERGRKTEIDYLNGYVVEQAKQVNIPTPVNAALVKMIKEIEAGERTIQPSNLDDLFSTFSP